MSYAIFGLKEGKNYPVRKNGNETVLKLGITNFILADIDYFLDHFDEIRDSLQKNRKVSNT